MNKDICVRWGEGVVNIRVGAIIIKDNIAITESFDWSLPFFEKNGYVVAAVRQDVPKGHCCYVLRKLLRCYHFAIIT